MAGTESSSSAAVAVKPTEPPFPRRADRLKKTAGAIWSAVDYVMLLDLCGIVSEYYVLSGTILAVSSSDLLISSYEP
jgi:hypothetical protein